MKKYLITIALLLALILMGTNSSMPGVAAQGEKGNNPDVVTITASRANMRATGKLWTREARAAAKSLDVSYEGLDELTAAAQVEEALGPAEYVAGGLPDPKAEKAARASFKGEWAQLKTALSAEALVTEADIDPTGTRGVYNVYRANYYSQLHTTYPYRTVGKLYFTTWDGGSAYCSASVFSPKNIIVTAAHCVYDTIYNRWQGSWVFVPAERNFVAPYGTYTWTQATVLTNWMSATAYNAGSIRYDMAVIKLNPNSSSGQPVTYYTGYLGRYNNAAFTQAITEIGYPSNLSGNTNGRYSFLGHAETYTYATDVMAWGSKMGYGASGSPMIKTYYPYLAGAANYVVAVQSGSSPNGTSPVFNVGPHFSSSNYSILCSAIGC